MPTIVEQIQEIRHRLITSIVAMIKNKGLTEISLKDTQSKTIVLWLDGGGYYRCGTVTSLRVEAGKLSVSVITENYPYEREISEDDFGMRDPHALDHLRSNLIDALNA